MEVEFRRFTVVLQSFSLSPSKAISPPIYLCTPRNGATMNNELKLGFHGGFMGSTSRTHSPGSLEQKDRKVFGKINQMADLI